MGTTTNRNPARRLSETSSLLGLMEFRPRLGIVLVFLTLTVLLVGWRIASDTGARRADRLAREAIGIFAAVPPVDGPAQPMDASEAERKFRELSRVLVEFPRGDPEFVPLEVRGETFAKRPAAALRFRYAGDPYLLVASTRGRLLGDHAPSAFPEGSFVSGERDGKSFVLWERKDACFIVVSPVDVTRTFGLVRRLLT